MINALIFFGGIALIVSIVGLLDWLARRKDQQSHAPRT
jgi:hypothetical protein